jgi:hypothetical protein
VVVFAGLVRLVRHGRVCSRAPFSANAHRPARVTGLLVPHGRPASSDWSRAGAAGSPPRWMIGGHFSCAWWSVSDLLCAGRRKSSPGGIWEAVYSEQRARSRCCLLPRSRRTHGTGHSVEPLFCACLCTPAVWMFRPVVRRGPGVPHGEWGERCYVALERQF